MARGAVYLAMVVALCGAASSCGGDSPPPPSIVSFCDGGCRGGHRCNSSVSVSLCNDACRRDPGNHALSSIRPEVAAIVGDCMANQLDCATLSGGTNDLCWERARDEIAPSDYVRTFCQSFATWEFECGYAQSVDDCASSLVIWTDTFLDSLAACTRQPTCDATEACLDQRFGGN
jgi:hypothetical protein